MMIDASSTIISWTIRMIARTRVGFPGRLRRRVIGPDGSLKSGARALEWRHPPVYMESASASPGNYTEDPSTLSSESVIPVPTQRPRRADAARNYDKLIVAAREAFTTQGEDASLEGIARRADVGI